MTSGPPLDPGYVAFRDGLKRADDDFTDASRWRFRLSDKAWYVFARADWILEEVEVANTPAPSTWGGPGNANDRELGDLYVKMVAKYEAYKKIYPTLVWTWLNGGDWHASWYKKNYTPPPQPEPMPVPGPKPDPRISPECKRRVDEVDAWVRSGRISPAEGYKLTKKIIEDCIYGNLDHAI